MPAYVARRAQDLHSDVRKPVRGSRVALLGITYKPDIADERESPSVDVAQALVNLGAHVGFHDPLVQEWTIHGKPVPCLPSVESAIDDSDIVFLLQARSELDRAAMGRSGALIFDTRGGLSDPSVHTCLSTAAT